MGKVVDTLTWAAQKALIKSYCHIDGTDHDTLLEALFDTAIEKADRYLNNPFQELRPTIVCASVTAGETVTLGIGSLPELSGTEIPERYLTASASGKISAQSAALATFAAATALDEDEREFAIGDTDAETATNLAALINSTTLGGSYGAVGVDGVEATVSEATITLARRYPGHGEVYVSSSDETMLLVRQVRTDIDLPKPVYQWICQFCYRHFRNRGAVIQESVSGQSMRMWLSMRSEEAGLIDNYDLIRPWKLAP